ncbi:hypothetical protein VaNZ11_008528, partial [Volvox africanus]
LYCINEELCQGSLYAGLYAVVFLVKTRLYAAQRSSKVNNRLHRRLGVQCSFMRLGFSISSGRPAARRLLAANSRISTEATIRRAALLPPPSLNGIAASNPRSVFNPLALAYLGDAVWEAHSRRLEAYIEAWSQQQQRRGLGDAAITETGDDGTAVNASSRREGQAVVKQEQQQRGAKGPGHGRGRNSVRAKPGNNVSSDGGNAGGSGLPWSSRQARKQWSTATFQALVFDALVDGSIPVPQLDTLPPSLDLGGLVAVSPQEQRSLAKRGTSATTSAQPDSSSPLSTIAPPDPASSLKPPTAEPAAEDRLAAAAGEASMSSSLDAGLSSLWPLTQMQPGGATTSIPQSLVLTAEELDVLRWGRNAGVSSVPKDVPVGVYKKATAVEVLVAHLYLVNPDRCAALITAVLIAQLPASQHPPGSTRCVEQTMQRQDMA